MKPYTVSLDFDGVLHEYHDGWEGGKIRGPVPGAIDFLEQVTAAGGRIVIHSCRDPKHIHFFLKAYGLEHYIYQVCPPEKPRAKMYVDDHNWPNGRHFDAALWAELTEDVLAEIHAGVD